MRRLKSVVGWRLPIGRWRVRLWQMGLLIAILAAAAGQAVGPIINGVVSGTAGLVIEQGVVVTLAEWRDYPPTSLYSISPRDDQLRVIDTLDIVMTDSSVTITLTGEVVEGGNGIAQHPVTPALYGLLKLTGQSGRELATIDPSTGVATSIGDTGDRFAGWHSTAPASSTPSLATAQACPKPFTR